MMKRCYEIDKDIAFKEYEIGCLKEKQRFVSKVAQLDEYHKGMV